MTREESSGLCGWHGWGPCEVWRDAGRPFLHKRLSQLTPSNVPPTPAHPRPCTRTHAPQPMRTDTCTLPLPAPPRSSRSHAIFTITVEQKRAAADPMATPPPPSSGALAARPASAATPGDDDDDGEDDGDQVRCVCVEAGCGWGAGCGGAEGAPPLRARLCTALRHDGRPQDLPAGPHSLTAFSAVPLLQHIYLSPYSLVPLSSLHLHPSALRPWTTSCAPSCTLWTWRAVSAPSAPRRRARASRCVGGREEGGMGRQQRVSQGQKVLGVMRGLSLGMSG